jgi:hypothetical protein
LILMAEGAPRRDSEIITAHSYEVTSQCFRRSSCRALSLRRLVGGRFGIFKTDVRERGLGIEGEKKGDQGVNYK